MPEQGEEAASAAQQPDLAGAAQEALDLLQTPCTTIIDTMAWVRWSERVQARLRQVLREHGRTNS